MLYKFKGNIGLGNPNFIRDIEMIRNDEIWCSNIKDLNDPSEASYSLNDFLRNLSNSLKIFSFLGIKSYNQNNINSYKNALAKVMNLHSEYCGVYSLSGNYNNELMWAHYSNSHKGFCIEYDFENLKDLDLQFSEQNPLSHLNRFGKVNYCDTLFQISTINPNYDDIIKFLFFKSKIWSYEEEYRVITNIAGKFKYNAKCIKSISFGLNMTDAEKSFIINNLREKEIDFYQMCRKNDKFEFYRELIKF